MSRVIHSLWPWQGDGSTLTLDFTTGVLDPRLTFTRTSTATFINASGLVATASTNTPRFDHDPTTGSPRGLLIEGQATNVLLNSASAFTSTGWFTSGTGTKTITLNHATSPDGTTTAARLQLGQNCALKQLGGTNGVNNTVSIWVRSNTGSNQTITFWTGTAAANRTVTTAWTRIEAVVNFASSTAFDLYNPNATDCDILIWGAQLETGSGASSYVATGASQVTRTQDLLSITSTNFSSWWTSNNPASFSVDFSSTNRPLANHIFRIADSSGSAYGYQSYFNSTTMPMQVRAAMSSTSSSDVAIGSNLAANTRTKVGFTIETAALKRFRDGSLASTLNTPTLPPNTMTQMFIGGTTAFGNASADFHIRQFKYWPMTLSDAAMQGFTT